MLEIQSISCSVSNQSILNNISFSVPSKQILGIIGPNGSGKTTLFNCLSGFLPLTGGRILFKGKEIQDLSPHSRALLGIGRVFQNFGIFREMTLYDNIRISLEAKAGIIQSSLSPSLRKKIKQQALEALEDVGLAEKHSKPASSLSGGQMRLLEIARCVSSGAELILLDEPTAGVSPVMKKQVGERIESLRKLGRTALIIEHDISFIQQYCDRVIVLNDGELLLDDSPEKVRNDPRLEDLYFGSKAAC